VTDTRPKFLKVLILRKK